MGDKKRIAGGEARAISAAVKMGVNADFRGFLTRGASFQIAKAKRWVTDADRSEFRLESVEVFRDRFGACGLVAR
jgi:hypothetical protein